VQQAVEGFMSCWATLIRLLMAASLLAATEGIAQQASRPQFAPAPALPDAPLRQNLSAQSAAKSLPSLYDGIPFRGRAYWSLPAVGPGSSIQSSPFDSPPANSDQVGSTNVPMDSWIYPALERLGSLGLVPFQSVAIRPWTRQECRRQLQQAQEILAGVHGHYYDVSDGIKEEAEDLIPQLERELQESNEDSQTVLESVYARAGTIAGPALTDGFHFGQTWSNDFGRPLGRGTSAIAGFSVRAVHRRFFFYDRQELQLNPTTPELTAARSELFYSLDDTPFHVSSNPPAYSVAPSIPAYLRQRPLDLYAGVAFAGYSLSFGKQELFWGPTTMGPLSFSSNAEPTYNLQLSATRPHPFPFFPTVGTYGVTLVFGKLSGHHFPARPYFNGAKADFTFGRLLEMSFTDWSILWGVGHPMTLHSLERNLFSTSSTGCGFGYGDRCDPGDRKSGFDFRLHVPGLRNYVTLYADSYADDEPSPLDAPRRAVWHPGIYFPRLLWLPHMDLRVEAASSEELSRDQGGTQFFINNQYRDGNTNKGFLLGNSVGRDARSVEARSGYWFSARTRVEGGYRQTKGGARFLPGGSTITDGFLRASYAFNEQWSTQAFCQYERFLIPSYMAGAQHNTSAWLQVTWNPKLSLFSR
jgi:hypothetical protein